MKGMYNLLEVDSVCLPDVSTNNNPTLVPKNKDYNKKDYIKSTYVASKEQQKINPKKTNESIIDLLW